MESLALVGLNAIQVTYDFLGKEKVGNHMGFSQEIFNERALRAPTLSLKQMEPRKYNNEKHIKNCTD